MRKLAYLFLLLPSIALAQSSAQIEANKGVLKVSPTTALPSPCRQGQLWFDSTTTTAKVCNDGVSWTSLGGASAGQPVSGCTVNSIVYIDGSGNLACGGAPAPLYSGGTVTISNGAAAASPLVVMDNVTPVLTVADGGAMTLTQPITLPGGTAASPALRMGSSNTGIYEFTPGHITFTTGGAARFNVEGSELVSTVPYSMGASVNTQDTYLNRHSAGVWRAGTSATAINYLIGGGAAVASATALPVPTGNVFHVTGTTTITSITSTNFANGAVITLIFDGILTFTDGSNLKLAGNFVTTADDTITLVYDGSNWYEVARSVN